MIVVCGTAGVTGERVRRASESVDCSRRQERSGGLLSPAREVHRTNSRWRAGSSVATSVPDEIKRLTVV